MQLSQWLVHTSNNNKIMNEIKTSEQRLSELKEVASPLIKYLCENHHPHVTAIVTGTGIELMEGIMSIPITEYIID